MMILQFIRRHAVKSFKVLLVSFLSAVLVVSSPGVLARGKLIEAVPEVYYLEEVDDGQNVRVTACYSVREGEVTFGEGLKGLSSNCDVVVEVSLSDLESFASQLKDEVDSVNPTSNGWKSALGSLGGPLFGMLALVVGGSVTWEGIFEKNTER